MATQAVLLLAVKVEVAAKVEAVVSKPQNYSPFLALRASFPREGARKGTPNPPYRHPSPVEGEGDSNNPSSNPF